jgi:predicted transcriptional regulator YheO
MTHPLWPYQAVSDAIATLLRPHAEVVLHDLSNGEIYFIANPLSKRVPGDPSLTELSATEAREGTVIGPYPKTNWDGRAMRSITAVIRPEAGAEPAGLMCINFDVSQFQALESLARGFIAFAEPSDKPSALFGPDWREEANEIVGQFLCTQAVTLASMSRQERLELVRLLDEKGLFDIRNSIPYLAQITHLSRATLYKTLKQARSSELHP